MSKLGRLESNILNNLPFKCQHADSHECPAVVKYENYKAHLKNECVQKIQEISLSHPLDAPVRKSYSRSSENQLGGIQLNNHVVQAANLPGLFKEEDEEEEENGWRFEEADEAVGRPREPVVRRQEVQEESDDDIDMGGLFGDDDDY